ncbi:MAG: hypothetical protein MUF18_13075, partial [Fimbriiglobus sp.]|nr:hypothetical protein [Fimbriiglobus sp.]
VSAILIPQADRSTLQQTASVAPVAAVHPLAVPAVQMLADLSFSDIPVTVTDGTRLSADFTPRLSGSYLLKFTDDTGLSGTRLLDFRVATDPAPVVRLDRPAVGKDPLHLLPTATTTVRAAATDRLFALKAMSLEYRVGGPDAPVRTLPLVDLHGIGRPLSGVVGAAAAAGHAKQPSAEAIVSIPVSAFVKPDGTRPTDGDRITLRAAATDFDDVSVLKDPGRSPEEVTILVVSRPTLDTILQQELAKLRPKLLLLREQQRGIRERTEDVQKAATEGKLTPEDSSKLGQAERDQRGVRNDLTDPAEGMIQAAELLRQTIRMNDVPRSTTTERVEALADNLTRLAERDLDPIEPLIASAKQEADTPKADARKAAEDLRKAVARQKSTESSLDSLLKLLEQWGGAGEVKAEARAIKEQLVKAGERAKAVSEKVEAGKMVRELSQREKADLEKAAEPFDQLAGRADAVIQKAQRLADEKQVKADELKGKAEAKAADAKATQGTPAADKHSADAADFAAQAAQAQAEANALRNAVKDAGNQGLKDDLQASADKLRQNNPAEATTSQSSAAKRLDAIAEALTEKQPDRAEELKQKGKKADEAFKLEQDQEGLKEKVKNAEKIADPTERNEELKKLAAEQDHIQRKAEELLERLTRDRQDASADKLRDSIDAMQKAKEQLEQGIAPNEKEQEALDRLKESVDRLDREQNQEEQKLGREKQRELAEMLKGLRDRLQAADDEAARLHSEVTKKKAWTLPLEKSLRTVSETLATVGAEVKEFTEKELDPLPVYKRLAGQAAVLVDSATKRFDERMEQIKDASGDPFDLVVEVAADERSRRPLKTAIRRLNHILDSLAEDPKKTGAEAPKPGEPKGQDGDMSTGPQGNPEQKGVPPLAQLKALRGVQAELNTRTRDFEMAHPDKSKLLDVEREELEELERSQREVAELFEQVKKEFEKLKSQQEPKLP